MIGSDNGLDAGTVNFEESDVLVGLTLQCNSESDKRPRRFGFTKMSRSASSSGSSLQQVPNAAAINMGSSIPAQVGPGQSSFK